MIKSTEELPDEIISEMKIRIPDLILGHLNELPPGQLVLGPKLQRAHHGVYASPSVSLLLSVSAEGSISIVDGGEPNFSTDLSISESCQNLGYGSNWLESSRKFNESMEDTASQTAQNLTNILKMKMDSLDRQKGVAGFRPVLIPFCESASSRVSLRNNGILDFWSYLPYTILFVPCELD